MKDFAYKVVGFGLRLVFPDKWVNKDTIGAVIAAVVVGAALTGLFALTGCHGGALTARYNHHSSVPDVNDLATSDTVGVCGKFYLQPYDEKAASMKVCLDKHFGRPSPFGSDPMGTVEIEKPFYTWGRK